MPKAIRQRGYALLIMLLILTLAAIAATAAAPSIVFKLKRDQEEELIHRGEQYSRAIRRYAKRNGKFPLSPEDLLGDGNIKYIRKLYKDPITGKDFRLLHLKDIPAVGGATNLNSSAPQQGGGGGIVPSAGAYKDPEPDPNASPTPQPANEPQPSGGLIFGVASRSHAKTIREFNRKNHYDEWLFFYDPHYDQGHEIKGPTPLIPAQSFTAQTSSAGQTRDGASPSDSQSQQ
jgi:type II secretory pathway pseudopilin PulG